MQRNWLACAILSHIYQFLATGASRIITHLHGSPLILSVNRFRYRDARNVDIARRAIPTSWWVPMFYELPFIGQKRHRPPHGMACTYDRASIRGTIHARRITHTSRRSMYVNGGDRITWSTPPRMAITFRL